MENSKANHHFAEKYILAGVDGSLQKSSWTGL